MIKNLTLTNAKIDWTFEKGKVYELEGWWAWQLIDQGYAIRYEKAVSKQ